MFFHFMITGDTLELISVKETAYTGNVNVYLCDCEFDEEWEGTDKFAVFANGEKSVTALVSEDNRVAVPFELLESGKSISVGFFGTSGEGENFKRISTGFAEVRVSDGAYVAESSIPEVPEPDLWEQLINRNIPKIGGNGNWYVWDSSAREYRDSGSAATAAYTKETAYDSATLLAMYNEILKPSPAEWFTVSGDTIMGFNMDNEDFNNATLLVFPYEINGVGIRHLDIDAWWDIVGKGVGVELRRNSNIKKVIIPNCIKDMQGEYFGQIFPNMASVNIPTGCASIGKGFFKGCAVKNITIPESVTQIGSEALNIGIAVNPGCVTVLNPDCKIDGSAFGIQPNVIIKGYTGSTAEKVAESLGAHFVSLEGAEFAEIESEMGDIDAALDGIIAIQNNFIGGESA